MSANAEIFTNPRPGWLSKLLSVSRAFTPHQVDNNLLSHPVLGLENFTAFALMRPLRNIYGTFQATDFQQLYLEPRPEDQKHD